MPGSQGAGDSEGTAILTSETSHVNNGSPPGAVTSPGGRMGGCGRCGKRCEGFLTDREQRKVWGIGILYVLGFPLLILMTIVGALKAVAPGDNNPDCPAEPHLPWMLIVGGVGIGLLLLLRIAITKCLRCITNNQTCCDNVAGCFCEFGCNLMYDVMLMVSIVMWMVPVTWWVFRHRVGPDALNSILGEQALKNFRYSLGDKDEIHVVQFSDPESPDYCDRLLYMVAFIILTAGWVLLVCALVVFVSDKIFAKIFCCLLCRAAQGQVQLRGGGEEEEQARLTAHNAYIERQGSRKSLIEPESPRTETPPTVMYERQGSKRSLLEPETPPPGVLSSGTLVYERASSRASLGEPGSTEASWKAGSRQSLQEVAAVETSWRAGCRKSLLESGSRAGSRASLLAADSVDAPTSI